MTKKMNLDEVKAILMDFPDWKVNSENRIECGFKFHSFPEAFSFMTRVAFEAERMNHHPEMLSSYNLVKIQLTTHDAGGITEKDLELARRIQAIDWT